MRYSTARHGTASTSNAPSLSDPCPAPSVAAVLRHRHTILRVLFVPRACWWFGLVVRAGRDLSLLWTWQGTHSTRTRPLTLPTDTTVGTCLDLLDSLLFLLLGVLRVSVSCSIVCYEYQSAVLSCATSISQLFCRVLRVSVSCSIVCYEYQSAVLSCATSISQLFYRVLRVSVSCSIVCYEYQSAVLSCVNSLFTTIRDPPPRPYYRHPRSTGVPSAWLGTLVVDQRAWTRPPFLAAAPQISPFCCQRFPAAGEMAWQQMYLV